MTDSADIGAEYRRRLEARRTALGAQERAHARFGYLRLLIAGLALAVLVVSGWKAGPWLFVLLFAFVAIAFAHARLLNARDQAASAVAYYERGLSRIAFEWIGHGRTGERFLPADHLYAADLDLFGRGSLFELLSTARTQAGEETIASWLLTPAPPATIRARQDAVRELTTRLDLRETVAVMGDSVRVGVDAGLLRRWSTSPSRLRGIGTRLALAGLSTATIAASVAWIATGRWEGAMAALLLLQGLVAQSFKARVQAVIHAVDEPAHDLDLLAGLLGLVERETFTSPYLHGLQQAIATDGRPASAQIAKLSQLVALLSSRQNILFAMPAAMLLWATQCSFAIEAWRRRAGAHVPRWLDAIGEFEALLSLATFAAEHPSYVFPTVVEGPATLATTAVAHPALPPAAVANDVTLDTRETALLVVSGSNMSGKSTLLRTLGANAVLAQMGAPVRASAFRLSPLALGAAIRVLDSLTDGRSRFFAEITRLKGIVDLSIARQGAVLFLLDEILGGTNSHDRRLGADALLTGLVEAGAIGLATTHDLALGEIADRLGVRARNVHFVDRFEHGELTFDYQIRPGLVRTSNAIALMRSIGLKV